MIEILTPKASIMSTLRKFEYCREFLQSLKLIFKAWKYGGIYPTLYISEDSIKYERSLFSCLVCCVLLLMNILGVFILNKGRNGLDTLMVGTYEAIYIINALSPIIILHFISPKIKDVLEGLLKIIEKLETSGDLKINSKILYSYIIQYFVVQVLLMSIQLIIEIILVNTHKVPYAYPDIFIMFASGLLDFHSQLFFLFIELVLFMYFKNLNKVSLWFSQKYGLRELEFNYAALNEVCLEFHNTLNIVVCLRFCSDFICILDDLYLDSTANFFDDHVRRFRVLDGSINLMQKLLTVGAFLFLNSTIKFQVRYWFIFHSISLFE